MMDGKLHTAINELRYLIVSALDNSLAQAHAVYMSGILIFIYSCLEVK